MNASRFFEVPVISIGEVRPERLEGATAEVLANRDGVYRKLVHHQGRLAGAILYGDISGAGLFYRRYRTASAPARSSNPGDTPGDLHESNTSKRPQACPPARPQACPPARPQHPPTPDKGAP